MSTQSKIESTLFTDFLPWFSNNKIVSNLIRMAFTLPMRGYVLHSFNNRIQQYNYHLILVEGCELQVINLNKCKFDQVIYVQYYCKMLCVGPRNNESNRPNSRRKSSLGAKKPMGQSVNLDQNQHDAKSYRLAMHCFLNNLNKCAKFYKYCLGQLEQWYKMPLSKDEQISLHQNITKVVEKNVDKMARDALSRNFNINKTTTAYLEEYGKYSRATAVGSNPEESKNQINQNSKPTEQTTIRPKSSCALNRKRPQSSQFSHRNEDFNRSSNQRNIERGIIDLNAEFTGSGEDMSCFILIRENIRKTFKYKNGLHSNALTKNDQIYCKFRNKSELYGPNAGDLSKTQSSQLKKQSRYDVNNRQKQEGGLYLRPHTTGESSKQLFSPTRAANIERRVISYCKKSREEMEKERIQNKILMLNSTLSTNAVTCQGYKPKTKCWGISTDSAPKKLKGTGQCPPTAKYLFFNKKG